MTITREQFEVLRAYLDDDCQAHLESGGKWRLDTGKLTTALEAAGVSVVGDVKSGPSGFVIPAKANSDDYLHEVKFDALEWFEQAGGIDVIALAECDWGGDYAADAVAEFYKGTLPEITEMFAYLLRYDDCGFECHVDKERALAWLKENRAEMYAALVEKGLAGESKSGS